MLLFISRVTTQLAFPSLLDFLTGINTWSIKVSHAELSCQSRSWHVSVNLVAILTMTISPFWSKRHFILSTCHGNMFFCPLLAWCVNLPASSQPWERTAGITRSCGCVHLSEKTSTWDSCMLSVGFCCIRDKWEVERSWVWPGQTFSCPGDAFVTLKSPFVFLILGNYCVTKSNCRNIFFVYSFVEIVVSQFQTSLWS